MNRTTQKTSSLSPKIRPLPRSVFNLRSLVNSPIPRGENGNGDREHPIARPRYMKININNSGAAKWQATLFFAYLGTKGIHFSQSHFYQSREWSAKVKDKNSALPTDTRTYVISAALARAISRIPLPPGFDRACRACKSPCNRWVTIHGR